MMKWTCPLVLFALLVMSGCSPSRDESSLEFASLSEDEKRLPENALASMTVAEGMEVQLFAAEPMITNPTNISVDHLGRVWVCEAYNYDVSPEEEDSKGDRIVVLEDTDHNGVADKRTVFYQGTDINTPLGIFVTGTKVYVSRSPNVFVFEDNNGDLVPDKKEVLFTNLGRKGDHSAHSVFGGPDGKLYFSTGNSAGEIKDKDGNPILDRAGLEVSQKGNPYLGGMIMRFDEHGKNLEVLGHNFRNNYEPCIDSYGNVWQSDNDDDGNESCRINFVMPYGNYGFLDEFTKATWTTNRVGLEEEVSRRHWHQDDPGVVPNILITGAGSPAGMTVYEGNELAKEFYGMPIHAEPYYNVVRGYLSKAAGAGFVAEIKDILKSDDQWFRPVDVCAAPDGSLFIADWYDPILGGGAAGDASQGRIYRVARKAKSYRPGSIDFSSVEGAADALTNPNIETRYAAYQVLISKGDNSFKSLHKIWKSQRESAIRARAFWVLAAIERDSTILMEALRDNDPAIRIAAIRFVLQNKSDVIPFLRLVSDDSNLHVQRELITALRYATSDAAADLWVHMARKYDGKDRWYLEALGIASDHHADQYFTRWVAATPFEIESKAHQDIVWRVRSHHALPLLGKIIEHEADAEKTLRFFRAFDFHKDPAKNRVLVSLLNLKKGNANEIASLALRQMDANALKMTSEIRNALINALEDAKGTMAYIDLVKKFELRDQRKELVRLAVTEKGSPLGLAAVDQLIRFAEFRAINSVLSSDDSLSMGMMASMRGKGNKEIIVALQQLVRDSTQNLEVRRMAIQTLGSSWPGEEALLGEVKLKSFAESLKPAAAGILFNVYRGNIQREAEKYLTRPSVEGAGFPSIKEMTASEGDLKNGETAYEKYCSSCHQVGERGKKFGPELSGIGSKLSKDGLFRAVIYPDEGISHGYSSSMIRLLDGSEVMGIIINRTDSEIQINQPGGVVNTYSMAQVAAVEVSHRSLMPSLAPVMKKQELIDLISYLSNLKNN